MDIINYFLLGIIIILLGLLIYISIKKKQIEYEYIAEKDLFLYNKNKISMIEYHYREFKEGQNPYTVLRKMSNTLKDFYD